MGIVDDLHGYKPTSKPRYRTRGSFTSIAGRYDDIDASCSSGTVTNSSYPANAGCNGEVLETWDMVTPNFSRRQRAGELITNPFRSLRESQTCSGTYCRGERVTNSCNSPVKKYVIDLSGPQAWQRLEVAGVNPNWNQPRMPRPYLISDADIASAITVACTKAWNKSNEHSADILVDIAEFSKTLRMLRDPIQSTSALLRKIKSGKRGAKDIMSSDVVDYASSLWLQYRFGIRPLVSSVQGVVKALEKIHSRRRQTHRGNYPLIKTDALATKSLTTGSPFNFVATQYSTDELSVRSGLVIEEAVSLSQELGVDASGMLNLPWELVPFSFVADWFANVNDYLGALVPYLTKSPLSSWFTTVRRSSTVFNVTSSSCISGWTLQRAAVETRSCTFEEKIRTPGLRAPSIAFKPQAISRVYNDARLIDSFALLQKQFLQVFKP